MTAALETSTKQLHPGEGTVVEIGGQKAAIYKSDVGKLTMVSAVCTHMGCTVGWNNKDKTWDCPCHGARFSKSGKVIQGPAVNDLPEVV